MPTVARHTLSAMCSCLPHATHCRLCAPACHCGLTPATSAPGLRSLLPHLRRDWVALGRTCRFCGAPTTSWSSSSMTTRTIRVGSAAAARHAAKRSNAPTRLCRCAARRTRSLLRRMLRARRPPELAAGTHLQAEARCAATAPRRSQRPSFAATRAARQISATEERSAVAHMQQASVRACDERGSLASSRDACSGLNEYAATRAGRPAPVGGCN